MRADYDSQGDTIQIELERTPQPGYGEDVENGAVIVSVYDDRAVAIDVIGTRSQDFETPLHKAAECYGLDGEALIAISKAAIAAPDRPVALDVGAHIAA